MQSNQNWDELPYSLSSLAVAAILAFGTDRFVQVVWQNWQSETIDDHSKSDKSLRSTVLFGMTRSISLSAQIYLGLCVLERVIDTFPFLQKHFYWTSAADNTLTVRLSQVAPSISLMVWTGLTVSTVKRIILLRSVRGKRLGRVALVDHLLDFVLFMLTFLNVLELLKIDMTVGIQSMLSAGGVGALVFSLASKDLGTS